MSLKDKILAANDRPTKPLLIPEWNETVYIRAISSGERDEIEAMVVNANQNKKRVDNLRARIAVRIVVDEQGNKVFTDADIPALAEKSAKALDRIFDAYVQFNKLTEDEAKEYEKNS